MQAPIIIVIRRAAHNKASAPLEIGVGRDAVRKIQEREVKRLIRLAVNGPVTLGSDMAAIGEV
jgi:hypothetical protein